ncbi:hypothetical protein OY671_011138, partial [Metschnikowia pulcherrima]
SGSDSISAKGNVDIQAQHDISRVQAQQDITIGSAQTAVEYAAPKRIRIATAAGASIVLEGGNITVTAPGRIDVKTGNKQFAGPDRREANRGMMDWEAHSNDTSAQAADSAYARGVPLYTYSSVDFRGRAELAAPVKA